MFSVGQKRHCSYPFKCTEKIRRSKHMYAFSYVERLGCEGITACLALASPTICYAATRKKKLHPLQHLICVVYVMAYKISVIPKYVLPGTPAPMGSRSRQSAKADHLHKGTSCSEQGKRGETVIKTIFPLSFSTFVLQINCRTFVLHYYRNFCITFLDHEIPCNQKSG